MIFSDEARYKLMIIYQNSSQHFAKNAVFSMERRSGVSHLHWHNAIEFVFILKGSLQFSLNNTLFSASEGELVVINSSIVHSFEPEGTADYYFLVADDVFFKTNNLYSQNSPFESRIDSPEAKKLFETIIEEYERADEFSNTAILSSLMALFVYLNRRHPGNSSDVPLSEQKKLKMIRRVLAYLQEHYKEKLTVEKIAEALHFSKSYLSHSFKEITRYSLISYINLLRCQNARAMLLSGSSVSVAAAECGFSEISYFTRVFKKTLGILPSSVEDEIFTLNSGEAKSFN